MKAPSMGYRIVYGGYSGGWEVWDDKGRTVWRGKTVRGARSAHYRLAVAKITGKPVSAAQARRAGNV